MYLRHHDTPPQGARSLTGAAPEDDPSTALIACAGNVANDHAVILGHGAPAVICALIRAGCISATELGRCDRPEAHTADLAIVPDVGARDDAALIIRHAKRALTSAGRIVLSFAAEPPGRLAQDISSLLQQQGFSAIRWRVFGARTMMSAALPSFGHLHHV
jgi:hypothetical protein